MSVVGTSSVPEAIKSLINQRSYAEAIPLLEAHLADHPEAEGHALLALAHFQREEYAVAATHYAAALTSAPDNADWRAMLAFSQTNAVAELHEPVPPIYFFEREKLLAPPVVPAGALPSAPIPPPPASLLKTGATFLGNWLGTLITFIMQGVTHLIGWVFGYRDTIWTNWYRRPLLVGILILAYMREKLNASNLKNTYPPGVLTGFADGKMSPPPGVKHFRTADGSWNNLDNPKEGAAGTRFLRNVNNSAITPQSGAEMMTPNPREISRIFLTRGEAMKEVPFLNLLAAAWIQFQNHDWVSHGEVLGTDVIEIPLAEDDPARRRFWQTKLFVSKTQPDPTRMEDKDKTPITFINEITHWWDGSQIYGSNQETVNHLRSGIDGKLRLNADGSLPVGKNGVEESGFVRNWWVGLTMLHTLFAREHNAICDHLKAAHPDWDDNRLFNVARLINAAVMAKIHSVEWTPAILPNQGLDAGLNANWFGLLTNFFRTGKQRKTLAPINIRNPEMGGVVGNPTDKHGQPYGLTEEFVEVYRLHSLLPEELTLRRVKNPGAVENIPFVATRQAGSPKLTGRISLADLFYSFGNQHPGQLVLNNFPKFMQEMSIPGNPLFDMGAVDILRARERGVPRYNEFRRQLGLRPIHTFDDLTEDAAVVQKLKAVYGAGPADVEKLDLMIGTLAEAHRPFYFGFGETMFQIFILNATRRLQADRFYTSCYNEETYSAEGLAWIDNSDFKSVLLRHYPELAQTGLANVKNAFEPWDTAKRLDPARHPLRAYARELKADPWQGDAP